MTSTRRFAGSKNIPQLFKFQLSHHIIIRVNGLQNIELSGDIL